MDTRRQHGQYWPGTRTGGGETPAPADNGKVDRVDLGTLPADATASEMRTAIRNIQNAIRPLATALAAALCGFAMAQTAAWDSLRKGVHVVTNEQDAAAMAAIATATNHIAVQMSELRSDNATAIAASTNGMPEAIADHGTRIGTLEEAAADRPDMSLYALRSEVPQAVDLAPYATTTDVVNRISAAASATKSEMAALTNAIHASIAPAIAAASTALQPAATNNIPETLESHAGEIARLAQSLAANQESNTAYRLMSPEGDIYQDATGVVWRVAYATNLSPWHVSVVAYTNGTTTATNEIPGVSSWSISGPVTNYERQVYSLHIPAGGNVYNTYEMGDGVPQTISFDIGTDVLSAEFGRTNIVTRYWTPADKVLYESSGVSGGITTNDVQAIVTNETEVWEFTGNVTPGVTYSVQYAYDADFGWYNHWLYADGVYIDGNAGSGAHDTIYFYGAEIEATYVGTSNAIGLARLSDLDGLASATSVSAANSRAASAQNAANAASNTAANVAGTVAAWETYWDGDEVRVTVTNYYGSQDIPTLYIEEKIENTNAYRVVWDERTRWRTNEVQMAELRSAIDEKADRAWGYYESHTGGYAPDGYTWISSPKIAIAGGLAYQRTLTASGAIWVLSSNGMVAQTGGNAENGFFQIKDDEGNTTIEIVRGNKRTVGANPAGIKVTSPRNSPTNTIEIPYNVTSDVPPTLYGKVSLSSPEWAKISATWTGQSGAWTGTVASSTSTYFVKGEYETGGETYIKNVAPISVESGIYCTDGIHKVRPVYSNGAITWELVTQ